VKITTVIVAQSPTSNHSVQK